jgi:hypothetical protein
MVWPANSPRKAQLGQIALLSNFDPSYELFIFLTRFSLPHRCSGDVAGAGQGRCCRGAEETGENVLWCMSAHVSAPGVAQARDPSFPPDAVSS